MDISKIPTNELLVDNPEEAISALAFNVGRLLEHIITTKISHTDKNLERLESKILYFRKEIMSMALGGNNINITEVLARFDQTFSIVALETIKE